MWLEEQTSASGRGSIGASGRRGDPTADLSSTATASNETGDLFHLVWPRLVDHLHVARTPQEVAERFSLRLVQIQDWLRRAEKEGQVARLRGRPLRYMAVLEPPLQDRLFEGAARYQLGPSPQYCEIPDEDNWGWQKSKA
jgi:hypothetical protein